MDIVLTDPYHVPLPDASVDVVLSGQMLEHCEFFWLAFQEMVRLMKPEGFIFLIAPSAGPIHRYPVDCYRFYPDAYHALAKLAGCHLQAVWRDERGPWQDLVGVFRRSPPPPLPARPGASAGAAAPPSPAGGFASRPEEELVRGSLDYVEVLAQAHALLEPAHYLEIGIRRGRSLALARCPAIAVDPAPEIDRPLPASTRIFRETSDDFFDLKAAGGGDRSPRSGLHRRHAPLRVRAARLHACRAPGGADHARGGRRHLPQPPAPGGAGETHPGVDGRRLEARITA